MSSLSDILGLFQRDIERKYGGRTVGKTLSGDEAIERIKASVLELVGKDRADFDGSNTWDNYVYGYNKAKEEIRAKIKEM